MVAFSLSISGCGGQVMTGPHGDFGGGEADAELDAFLRAVNTDFSGVAEEGVGRDEAVVARGFVLMGGGRS